MDCYATIECPRCKSKCQLKLATISSGPLLCPVCSEGEVEFNTVPMSIIHYKSKFLFECKNPLIDYNACY